MAGRLTPTEERILRVLADGRRHTRLEVHVCLNDELAQMGAIRPHISRLRRKLRKNGEDVICEFCGGTVYYRIVRIMLGSEL